MPTPTATSDLKPVRHVQIYTGDGKGKSTAAFGLALRALGAGWRVLIVQFLKRGEYNEIKALRRLHDRITVLQFGQGHFIRGEPPPEEIAAARAGLKRVREILLEDEFDLIVLDEINVAVHLGLLPLSYVQELLTIRPVNVELILTGRWAAPELIEQADLVTEMRSIKHYYQQGVTAREGIEK